MPLYPPASGGGVTIEEVIDTLYPVGSIYISTLATNPGTLLGRGTWVVFGAGKVLVGIDSGDTDFDTLEETGGAKTHTLIESEIPAHSHVEQAPTIAAGGVMRFGVDTNSNGIVTAGISTESTGGGGAHNNLQPYIVVSMWKRTS